MSDGDTTPRPLSVRRQRQYNKIPRTQRYLYENGLLEALEGAPHKSEERRAVSSSVAAQSQAGAGQSGSAIILRRQPSLKHRLLNRMVSGFSSKLVGNDICESNDPPSLRRSSRDISRQSTDSSISAAGSLIDLDGALASFPTPPSSAVTSPKTQRSLKSTSSPVQTRSGLSIPQRLGILAVETKVVPCHDRGNLDYSNVAVIEINAKIHGVSPNIDLQSHGNALDIVVVIDNSLFNCPALLMSSCEVTSILASFLDSTADRMAILCTMPADRKPEDRMSTTIAGLDLVNPKNLKAALDGIASSTVQPDAGVLIEAIKGAHHMLRDSERTHVFGALTYQTFGHVIVLTADASHLCGEDLNDATIQTHVLSTSIPQNRVWDKVECNGWKMCLLDSFLGPNQSRSRKKHHPRSLNDKLQALVQHARSGQLTDCLENLVVEIEPQAGCTKERVLGNTRFPRLQIGETKTIVISLITEARFVGLNYSGTSDIQDINVLNTDEDLMVEISQMLAFPKDKMFTVNLRYKHSSLPKDTICAASTICLIKMQSLSVNSSQPVRKPVVSKGIALLHQRLAEYYAAYYTPRDALTTIWKEFGEEGCRSACPTYIIALADELKYQARIAERIAIENSPKKPLIQQFNSASSLHTAWSCSPSAKGENQKPVAWTKDSDSEPHTPNGPQTKLVEQLGLDDAGKIWSDMRHKSRGEQTRHETRTKRSASPGLRERGKVLADSALRSQRSMADLTLRAMVTNPQRVARSTLLPSWV